MSPYATVLFLVLATLVKNTVLADDKPAETKESPKCECGLFSNKDGETTTETPVVSKTPDFKLNCDTDGRMNCLNMCKALSAAAKEKEGPAKLCEYVPNANHFVPKVYYKACGDAEWHFTGIPSTIDICCKDKVMVECS